MQLEWMVQLRNYRNDYLDIFFRFLHFFDTLYFLYILAPFIIIGISYKWGIKIYTLIVLNGLINYGLKILFKVPRPSVVNPDLALINVGEYSFPSGAAQFSIVLASLLIFFWKSPYAKVIGISYVLLIGFSRVYLGVHYPTDVVVGWAVGLIVIIAFFKCMPTLEKMIKKNVFLSFILSLLIVLAFMILYPSRKTMQFASSFLAIIIGSYFTFEYKLYLQDAKTIFSSIFRGSIAVLSTYLFFYLFSQFHLQPMAKTIFINAGLSLWIVLGISPLIKKLHPNY